MQSALLYLCVALAAVGAGWDIRLRRIPNVLCLLLAAAALAYASVAGGENGLLWGLAHAALALPVGMGLFTLGMIGGGDAKFYSAAALAIPLPAGLYFLGWTSAAGLVLLFVIIVGNRLFGRKRKSAKEFRKMEMPYGVAIACGFAMTMFA
jgi:prepilin peptidase CpaA